MTDEQRRGPDVPKGIQVANAKVDRWFTVVAMLVVDLMALVALITLAWSAWGVCRLLFEAISAGHYQVSTEIIIEILTIFIIVEVLAVSMHFLRVNRIDIRDLVDVTLAIVFREVWVGMFSKELHWQELVAMSFLIAALGALRLMMTRQRALKMAVAEDGD